MTITTSFSQPENGQDLKGMHASLLFGNTRIIMTNNFIQSQQVEAKNMFYFTGVPAGDLKYSVTGPHLQITIDEKTPKQHF